MGRRTMTTGWGRWSALALVFGALALPVSAAPGPAPMVTFGMQQADNDCRCVDRDGNQVADCTCLRSRRFEMLVPPLPPIPPMPPMRPRLGISVATDQGSDLDARGAHVTNVLEDGPAWNAGIREGDVITEIDGQSLFQPLPGDDEDDFDLDESVPVQRLLAIARGLEPGEEVDVTYLRGGQERTATVSAEDLSGRSYEFVVPDLDVERFREQMRGFDNLRDLDRLREFEWRSGEPGGFDLSFFDGAPGASFFGGPALGRYGLQLVALNEGLGQYFGTTTGVLVVDADEDSTLGLEPGDVILRIGERPADTPERVVRILGTYGDDEDVPIRVRRDGREIEVMGRVEG
jgi:hypothetical protein